jgi:LacI family transcriptional regulator
MATIKDVARLAGVGVGTASRAISGNGPVSQEAVGRVRKAIAELDFRPSNIARALSSKTLGTIGLYVPYFSGPFFGPVLQSVNFELREVDRHMVAANGCGFGDPRRQALDGVDFLIQRECDGIIVFSNELQDQDLIALHRKQHKIAVLNRMIPELKAQCFSVDHYQGGRIAAQVLGSQGHRRLAVISGLHSASDNEARLAGFFDELTLYDIAREDVPVMDGDFNLQSGWEAASCLLDRHEGFTGLFCANDNMAMAAIARFQQSGKRVPEDLSVVGYDDSEPAAFTFPRLTTIRIPIQEMAANACRLLLHQCYGIALEITREFIPTLVWRESVALGPFAAATEPATKEEM